MSYRLAQIPYFCWWKKGLVPERRHWDKSKPNRWLVPWGHEDTCPAWVCSADLWFQRSAWAEMIMQAAPWAPSSTIKVIRVPPPLHIQPYGQTMDRWVFNCSIVDPIIQCGGGDHFYAAGQHNCNTFTFSYTSFQSQPELGLCTA